MIGEIISGGLSLLGGLFGSKKKSKPEVTKTENTTTSSVDYVKMADAAIAAGFNPLTALRNGGSAGFSSSTSVGTSTTPGLSSSPDWGSAMGEIGRGIGAAFDAKFDPITVKRNKVENALLDYQLATITEKPKAPSYFGEVPAKSGTAYSYQKAPPLSNKQFDPARFGKIVPGQNPTASSLGMEGSVGWYHDPTVPDAQVFEDIYGEPGSWVGGAIKGAADTRYTARKRLEKEGFDLKKVDDAAVWPVTVGQKAGNATSEWANDAWAWVTAPPTTDSLFDRTARHLERSLSNSYWFGKSKKGGRVAPETSW